ncbi:sugar transferase [Nocardioides sp. 1609]|uniref:sugar transferase n=1 Tax=Nocardioides sp. 1609 TaxID=2508327 RepID=UPI00106F8C55|nr:sugar transferase [Nocardioides sp. 1609]
MSLLMHRVRGESRLRVPLPSRTLQYLPATAFALDAVLVVLATLAAVVGRERWHVLSSGAELTERMGYAGPLLGAGWLAAIWLAGGYAPSLFDAGTDEFRRVARATFATAAAVGIGAFLLKFPLSRGFFVLAFGIGIPALLCGRLALRRAVQRARKRGALSHSVLIAGLPGPIDEVATVLSRESGLGYRVVGALTPTVSVTDTAYGVPVLGLCTDVVEQVRLSGADVVFFASGGVSSSVEMRRLAWDLERESVQVIVAPSVSDVSGERVHVRPVGGLPLIHIDPTGTIDAVRWGKRLFDVLGSAALILALSPVFVFAALRIWAHDGGPVLFRQVRIGRDGEEFPCLKLRTMVVDAEAHLARLHAETGYAEGLFKMAGDPRVTRPGAFLRRFSIDELPQLFNVLRGEMSLVGPRPPLPTEVATYDDITSRRLNVRPGMTGLWQVSGRSDLAWSEAVRLDLFYVDNWSMFRDLSILMKTFGAVVGSRGAY